MNKNQKFSKTEVKQLSNKVRDKQIIRDTKDTRDKPQEKVNSVSQILVDLNIPQLDTNVSH